MGRQRGSWSSTRTNRIFWRRGGSAFVLFDTAYGYTALTQLDCLDDCLDARRACAMSCLGVNRHFACSLGWGQGLVHVLYHVSGVACCDRHGRHAWQHLAMLLHYPVRLRTLQSEMLPAMRQLRTRCSQFLPHPVSMFTHLHGPVLAETVRPLGRAPMKTHAGDTGAWASTATGLPRLCRLRE